MANVIKQKYKIGQRFGKLTIVEYLGYTRNPAHSPSKPIHHYKCKCDCGAIRDVRQGYLRVKIHSVKACVKCIDDASKTKRNKLKEIPPAMTQTDALKLWSKPNAMS